MTDARKPRTRGRSAIGAISLAAALTIASGSAHTENAATYPDWKGQWYRDNGVQWDPTKPQGRPQQPPLTPEYQAIWEKSLARQESGGGDDNAVVSCLPPGVPRAMIVYEPMEVIIPETTYIMLSYFSEMRRLFTDGRDWPKEIEPSFVGYSLGHWEDTDGDGRYDTLVVETRGFKGPRTIDARSIPLHEDNQTIVKERLALDRTKPDVLTNEITIIDHALTRPWTVTRSYRRLKTPSSMEYVCAENNNQVVLEGEDYMIGADGELMPTRKDQPPPDLRYFKQTGK
jgi:hypothetical protein